MQDINERLRNIQLKLKAVSKLCQQLQKESESNKKEIARLQALLKKNATEVEAQSDKKNISHLGMNEWNEDGRKRLEAKLDAYLKEIEQCLSILNK